MLRQVLDERQWGTVQCTEELRSFKKIHWRDYISFYEYFHDDNGAGLGASHQTGWTGLIAGAMHLFATTTPEQALELRKKAAFAEIPMSARKDKAAAASSKG